ncbi:MAG: CCA tRNA nucleotidyltransferase [Magnetococcales bacterium]|nr:CCA tRNA nucleotidyltransferase [Magnetococcales bacterium]
MLPSSLKNVFSPVLQNLLDLLCDLIGPAYLVGGVLRDVLQNNFLSNDLNLIVPLSLAECQRRLHQGGFTDVVMGNRPNSLLLPLRRHENPKTVEIATYRHRPGVSPTVEEDLFHRDITVNAMAYKWPDGPLVDPFGGLQDLYQNRIRLVNGEQTLVEDPLRALRFFRFLLQLGANPAPQDLLLCQEMQLGSVSGDRVRAELDQVFSLDLEEASSRSWINLLFSSRLGSGILPELYLLRHRVVSDEKQPYSIWDFVFNALWSLDWPEREEEISLLDFRWALLLHALGWKEVALPEESVPGPYPTQEQLFTSETTASLVLERLRFSKRRARRIMTLIAQQNVPLTIGERFMRRLINQGLPLESLLRFQKARLTALALVRPGFHKPARIAEDYRRALVRCQASRRASSRFSPHDLALSGGDLLNMVRLPPGPWLGKLQGWLVDWISQDPGRNKKEPLENQVRMWIANKAPF